MQTDKLNKSIVLALLIFSIALSRPALAEQMAGYFLEVSGPVKVYSDGAPVRDAVVGQRIASTEKVRAEEGGYALVADVGAGFKRIEVLPGNPWSPGKSDTQQVSLFKFPKSSREGGVFRGTSMDTAWGLPSWTVTASNAMKLDWTAAAPSSSQGIVRLYSATGAKLHEIPAVGSLKLTSQHGIAAGKKYFWALELADGSGYRGAFRVATLPELEEVKRRFDAAPPAIAGDPSLSQDYKAAVLIDAELYLEAASLLGQRYKEKPSDRVAYEWLKVLEERLRKPPLGMVENTFANLAMLTEKTAGNTGFVVDVRSRRGNGPSVPLENRKLVDAQNGDQISYSVRNNSNQAWYVKVFYVSPSGDAQSLYPPSGKNTPLGPGEEVSLPFAVEGPFEGIERFVVIGHDKQLIDPAVLFSSRVGPGAYTADSGLIRLIEKARFPMAYDSLKREEFSLLSSLKVDVFAWRTVK